jgi:hypothetical protein
MGLRSLGNPQAGEVPWSLPGRIHHDGDPFGEAAGV